MKLFKKGNEFILKIPTGGRPKVYKVERLEELMDKKEVRGLSLSELIEKLKMGE